MDADVDELDEIFTLGTMAAGLAIVAIAVTTAFFDGRHDILQSRHAARAKVQNAHVFCTRKTDHRLLAALSRSL